MERTHEGVKSIYSGVPSVFSASPGLVRTLEVIPHPLLWPSNPELHESWRPEKQFVANGALCPMSRLRKVQIAAVIFFGVVAGAALMAYPEAKIRAPLLTMTGGAIILVPLVPTGRFELPQVATMLGHDDSPAWRMVLAF